MSESSATATFVWNDTEVKLTGREAKREVKGRQGTRFVIRLEITPADNEDGSWKKWVLEKELLTISDDQSV